MKRIVSFLLLALIVTSCSKLKQLGFRSYENPFTLNLKAHTVSKTLYRDFSTIAIAKATHFNKELMKEYIEYTQGIKINKTGDRRYLETLKDCDKYDVFWLAFYTDDDDINNLSSMDSFWNVYIVRNGKILEPVSIKEVGLNDFKKQWLYLVKFHRWARQYVIKFKKPEKPEEKVTLVIASYLGEMDMTFRK